MSHFDAIMRDLDEDPFFNAMNGPFQTMRQMMAPFGGMFGGSMFPQLMGPNQRHSQHGDNSSLMPFGFGHSLFPNMDGMFRNFEHLTQNPNSHCYSSSSVMTYTTDETGRPQLYQASSSTRTAPGGVKETRKTLQDSRSGMQKISIGHHLGERGHVLEHVKNRATGEEEENEELLNLDEEELGAFNNEWKNRAQPYAHRSRHEHLTYRDHPRFGQRSSRIPGASEQLAITAGPSSAEHEQPHSSHKRSSEGLSVKEAKQKKKQKSGHSGRSGYEKVKHRPRHETNM
ncbi:myeloid leukemia factor 1-like [Tachypleus tridentatus]|uniref:myeloid leukemia factor 1-like n=1 Tax=Tachypleus tridentatus TaxID=6853 RepID=UPI003FD0DFF9